MPIRADEQRSLTRDTTEAELQHIATRAEEAAAAAAAGEFGFTEAAAKAARFRKAVKQPQAVSA